MLKYRKSVPYLPDLARSRPSIGEDDRSRARATPPHPVPHHCLPWIEGQSAGWNLCYGFLTPVTIIGRDDGQIEVANLATLQQEANQPRIIDQFALGYFGLGTGYTLLTPAGFVCLILPPVAPPPNLQTITGVVQTDWYPRQLFLVFQVPPPGIEIRLEYGQPLARTIVIPRPDQVTAEPISEAEAGALDQRQADYLSQEQSSPSTWTAASGDTFTHLYRDWSRRYGQPAPEEDATAR